MDVSEEVESLLAQRMLEFDRDERLQVAVQMMAALVPHMLQYPMAQVAERAVELADALIEAVDK